MHLSDVLDAHMKYCAKIEKTIDVASTSRQGDTVALDTEVDESTGESDTSDDVE
jgi:hypothetical protein